MIKKFTTLLAITLAFSSISVAQCPDGIDGPVVVPAFSEQTYTLYDDINGTTVNWPHSLVNNEDGTSICNPATASINLGSSTTNIENGLITAASQGSVTVVWGEPGTGSMNLLASAFLCDNTGEQFSYCSPFGYGIDVLITPATNISEVEIHNFVTVTPTALFFDNTSLLQEAVIFSITGDLVAQFSPKNQNTFDLQQLSAGMYVLKLSRMDGGIMTTKFSHVAK